MNKCNKSHYKYTKLGFELLCAHQEIYTRTLVIPLALVACLIYVHTSYTLSPFGSVSLGLQVKISGKPFMHTYHINNTLCLVCFPNASYCLPQSTLRSLESTTRRPQGLTQTLPVPPELCCQQRSFLPEIIRTSKQ